MEINYARIGERIRYVRIQNGLSQEDLAEFADISAVYISNIERGTKSPSLKVIIAVANALNTSTDSLLLDSLTIKKNEHSENLFSVLSDCTAEEIDILTVNLRQLKETLRHYKITE